MLLTKSEMAYMGRYFPGAGEASPFKSFKNEALSGGEAASLTQKGAIAGEGVNPVWAERFGVLASPEQFSRVRLVTPFGAVEKYAYKKAGRLVVCSNRDGGFDIDTAGEGESVMEPFAGFILPGKPDPFALELRLPPEEALTLLAVIDLWRLKMLREYIGEKPEPPTVQDLIAYPQKAMESGLYPVALKAFALAAPADMEASLARLRQGGLVAENSLALRNDLKQLAYNLKTPEMSLSIENAAEGLAETNVFTALCLLGNAASLGFFFDNEQIDLVTLNGYDLLMMIARALKCSLLGEPETETAQTLEQMVQQAAPAPAPMGAQPAPAQPHVYHAGQPQQAGYPMAPPPPQGATMPCPKCGAQQRVGAKFCNKCGSMMQ